jgi:hypothetical protein
MPEHLGGNVLLVEGLELSPRFGFHALALRYDREWRSDSAAGVLGGDVWGRFHATIDPAAGVLVLSRPRVHASGSRQACESAEGEAREESCFSLVTRKTDEGIGLVGTVWRDLAEGVRIQLEPLGADGRPLSGLCRIGLTFAPGDRGQSTAEEIPWDGLGVSIPECGRELAAAKDIRFSFLEEAPEDACSGNCVYAEGLASQKMTCECQGQGSGEMDEMVRRFMEHYRKRMSPRQPKHRAPEPDEPKDPGAE